MANNIVQYEAYSGTTSSIMPPGNYFQARRVSRQTTANQQLWQIWRMINEDLQKMTASGAALQPVLGKALMQDTLGCINRAFGNVANRVVTRANRVFSSTFGGPNPFEFMPYPIRWPGENTYALMFSMSFISSLFQIPEVRSNELDMGVLDDHATIILRPLFDLKAQIMKEYFGYEIKGEISADELDAVFSDSTIRPPLHISFSENRTTTEDRAKKAALAKTTETVVRPTEKELLSITSGQDVWVWVPKASDWATFAETQRRLESDGPHSTPAQPFPFTTGAIGGSGVIFSATPSP